MATAEGSSGRNWTAAEFEDAVAEMFRRLPGVSQVEREWMAAPPGGGRPVSVDIVVRSEASSPVLPELTLVEVTGARGGAPVRTDLRKLSAARSGLDGQALIVSPWVASKQTKEIAAPFWLWDREHLLNMAKQFPEALAPVLPFLEATKPKPRTSTRESGEAAEKEFPFQPIVSIQLTDKGWRVECDAYVLRLGPEGRLEGPTLDAFIADTGGQANGQIRKALAGKRITPLLPRICPLKISGLPPKLILATAYRPNGECRQDEAITGIIRAAAAEGFSVIALPLIGATEVGGLKVLDAILQEVSTVRLILPLEIIVVVATEEEENYARHLFYRSQPVPPKPEPAPSPPPTSPENVIPPFNSDTVGGWAVDRLEVDGQARSFARLLAASSTPMPLAVGLFGMWGSGKSFFMKLIQQEMGKLADGNQDGYCTKVAHITFNAWHYVDSDLWASLALRIFDGVAAKLAGQKDDEGQKTKEAEERRKLAEGTAASRRLKAELAALGESRRTMDDAISKAYSKRQEMAKDIGIDKVIAALKGVNGETGWKEAKALLSRFGVAEPKDLAELEKSLDSVNASVGSLGALLPGFLMGRPWLRWGGLLVGLVGLTFLVPMWESLSGAVLHWIGVQLEPLGPLAAAAAALAGWVAKRLETIKGVPARIEDLRKRLDAAKAALTPEKADEAGKQSGEQKDLASLDQQIAVLERRIAEADKNLAAAGARLEQMVTGALIYDFLRERAGDTEYKGRTGIISVLREDLSRLQEQLHALDPEKARIQRIVLYIDDLDRCEPDRVVDVLQAVHLLLAFELFAVVVAVDARWLERSLYRRYLNGAMEMTEDEREAGAFSPQNYLEKIFQIPYRIPPIGAVPFGKLVKSLVASGSDEPPAPLPPENDASRPEESQGDDGESSSDGGDDDGQQASETDDEGDAKHEEVDGGTEAAVQNPAKPQPQLLVLDEEEIEAIMRLNQFVSTPRAVKRLVNVYVMIRMQIAEGDEGLFGALKNDGAWELILLLGIDIGFPRASQVLRHVLEKDGAGLADWPAVLGRTKAMCLPDRPHLMTQIEKLETAINDLKPQPGVGGLRRWLYHVDRFSFHAAEALGEAAKPGPQAQEKKGPAA